MMGQPQVFGIAGRMAEDLYLEPATGYLWNLTEYETEKYGTDNRCVFAVRLSDYD